MNTHRLQLTLTATLCAALLGCGGGADDVPDLAEVTGVVKFGGKPVPGAQVVFQPLGEGEAGGRPSQAETDADGSFSLKYAGGLTGAKLGEHSVTVTVYGTPGETPASGPGDAGPAAGPPKTYRVGQVEVTPETEKFHFELANFN